MDEVRSRWNGRWGFGGLEEDWGVLERGHWCCFFGGLMGENWWCGREEELFFWWQWVDGICEEFYMIDGGERGWVYLLIFGAP